MTPRRAWRILQRLELSPSDGQALDIGCGAGFIADHLRHVGWRSVATDVADYRGTSGFDFLFGQAEALPFSDETFSLVISNHIIEHVFDPDAHLREVWRVLVPGGLAYVAMPNRLRLWEAHYKLPALSLLPRRLANAYVRLLGRGKEYDVFPLTRSSLIRQAEAAGQSCQDVTRWAIGETAEVEESRVAKLLDALPDWGSAGCPMSAQRSYS